MAFIRCSSNPESLYIWGGADKMVTIVKGPKTIGRIPTDIFKGLLKKFKKDYEDCKYKGAEIKQLKIGKNFKHQLTYDGWKLNMWAVTWYYIVEANCE